MSVNLVRHIYTELERIIRSRDGSIPIHSSFPDEKELPPRLFVIEHTAAEPASAGDGSIDLDMRWEIRFIKKISDPQSSRHDVQDMSWKIGALFHKAIIPSPYAGGPGEPGFPVFFLGSQDDNFDVQVQTFESWVTELSVQARVGYSLFDEEGGGL